MAKRLLVGAVLLACLTTCLTGAASAQSAGQDARDVAEYLKKAKAESASQIAKWQDELKAARLEKTADTGARARKVRDLEAAIKAERARKFEVPELTWPFEVGQVGAFMFHDPLVSDVIDPTSCEVELVFHYSAGVDGNLRSIMRTHRQAVVYRGIDTTKMAENVPVKLPAIIEVTDTTKGIGRTLFVIERWKPKP